MHIQPIKTFANFRANTNKVNFGATNPQAAQDTAKGTGKINKKTAAIVGGLAALAFAGTVAAVAIKRHKAPELALDDLKITKESLSSLIENIQRKGDEAVEFAQRVSDEVTELFKKGDEIAPDGTVLRKITNGDDGQKIMEEFSQKGALVRRSHFADDILDSVEEGIEEFADGSRKIAKEVEFEDGMISWYEEGRKELADGSFGYKIGIEFEDKKPVYYFGDFKMNSDETLSTATDLMLDDEGWLILTDKGWQRVSEYTEN